MGAGEFRFSAPLVDPGSARRGEESRVRDYGPVEPQIPLHINTNHPSSFTLHPFVLCASALKFLAPES